MTPQAHDHEFTRRFELAGKKAIITGASRGIGQAIAEVYADAGADLVLMGRDEDALADTRARVEAYGVQAHCVPVDLADVASTQDAGRRALELLGGIDILVNNAGVALIAPLTELTLDQWDQTMAINLRAPFVLSQVIAPVMIQQRHGKIVNVASQTGVIAADEHGAYAASKGGLNALTKVMACEWGQYNIQVNSLCPTVILTPMGERVWGPPEKGDPMKAKIPLGRFGQPVEVADLALFLASSASDFITGTNMMIDGGYTAL